MQNDGGKIDWNDKYQDKYHIYYCSNDMEHFMKKGGLNVGNSQFLYGNQIHFHIYEIAQRAIDEIVKPFMKEHPECIW